MANCTNLKLIDGGSEIKQGDFSSAFSFEFLDEKRNIIKGLDGKNAVVILKADDVIHFKKSVVVADNSVKFTIDKTLNAGVYVLEIYCDGYVFPSNNSFRITVIKSIFSDESLKDVSVSEDVSSDKVVENTNGKVIIDGMSLTEIADYLEDIQRKFNDTDEYTIDNREIFRYYLSRTNVLLNNVNDDTNSIVFSPEDFRNINFYLKKLKEVKIVKNPDEIISSIGGRREYYSYNNNYGNLALLDSSYHFINDITHDLYNDGNYYFAVKLRSGTNCNWEIIQDENCVSIYSNAVSSAMTEDFSFGNWGYVFETKGATTGTCIVIKHDPRVNEKGSFTVKATNVETGEVITREFIVE